MTRRATTRARGAYARRLAVGALLLLAVGCGSAEGEGAAAAGASDAAEAVPEPVLYARVNGTPITDRDLYRAVSQKLGGAAMDVLQPEARREALDGLVLQRAMALEVERRLTPERREMLESLVADYREALLAQEYLRLATADVPFTEEMVERYWRENPELFGGRTLKRYELLSARSARGEAERAGVLELLAHAEALAKQSGSGGGEGAWVAFAQREDVRDAGLVRTQGDLRPGLLAPQVEKVVASLEPGQVSGVLLVDGAPYLARVIGERQTPPRPYAEVRDEARTRLQAIEIRKAVEGMKGEVLARADVEYLPAAPGSAAGEAGP